MIIADLKRQTRSYVVKQLAAQYGFMDCKIANATFLSEEAKQLESWLNRNRHGEMSYMENHFDLRTDPTKLVPSAKSIIVFSQNYFPVKEQMSDAPRLAKYAYGKDYHKVIRKKLKSLLKDLNDKFGEVNGRGFVDSAPVMEKAWAKRAGIGWVGKHTNVITKRKGSYYFLAVLLTDLELAADEPVKDHCGKCTACIDACPTNAIDSPYNLDASKCISYATIELKTAELPPEFSGKMGDWMFGCDICQDVCPWNRFSSPHQENAFLPREEILGMERADWFNLKEEKFEELFTGSAVRRTKYGGLMRNIRFLSTDSFE